VASGKGGNYDYETGDKSRGGGGGEGSRSRDKAEQINCVEWRGVAWREYRVGEPGKVRNAVVPATRNTWFVADPRQLRLAFRPRSATPSPSK